MRDWAHLSPLQVLFPYNEDLSTRAPISFQTAIRFMWPFKADLWARKVFGGQTYKEVNKPWFEFGQIPVERFKIRLSIAFAEVATHNHFVLDRGGKVFNRTAPVIKLPAEAAEDNHLALLGLLNSSTACFWMKQVFHNKGSTVDGKGARQTTVAFENFYQMAGTGLKKFPIAEETDDTLEIAKALDTAAQRLQRCDVDSVLSAWKGDEPLDGLLADARARSAAIERHMIALQEELDWHCYRLYGLTEEDVCHSGEVPEVRLGERAFEIHLARRMAAGEVESTWFQRHGSMPITEVPGRWPADYRALVQKRLEAIEQNRWIGLVERPEYKRRWNREPWEKRQQRALREWMLDHLESLCHAPSLLTCAQLADRVRHNTAFHQVAALYTGDDLFDAQTLVSELVAGDEVPQMAACRYKPAAMEKFRAWQHTWDLQRLEDAIDARTALDPSDPDHLSEEQAVALKVEQVGDIALPPKYKSSDFRKASYWPLRGKLDVPRERFFSLPGCEKAGDSTLVIGWAGLDHLQRAKAIAGWYVERKEQDGWEAERLTPMLAALDELVPWLKQWHHQMDPEFGQRLDEYFEGFLLEELRGLGLTRDDLRAWRPPAGRRGRRSASRRSGTAA